MDNIADVYGHKTALICESSSGVVNRYSYLELNQEINRTANLFIRWDRKGDKVALHLDNCPEFIFCWFGLAKLARLWCRLTPACYARKARGSCQNSQACLLVTSAQLSYVSTDSAGRCHSIAAHLPDRCGTSR
ncbi:AMP-binding protein [Escherichia coli]